VSDHLERRPPVVKGNAPSAKKGGTDIAAPSQKTHQRSSYGLVSTERSQKPGASRLQAARSLRRHGRRARSRLAPHRRGVKSSCRRGVDSGCRLTPGAPRVLYRNTNSHALFAAGIQYFVRENMVLSAVSAVVRSSWLLRAAALQKAPSKMTFAGSNPPCPATQCSLHYAISGFGRTADIPAGYAGALESRVGKSRTFRSGLVGSAAPVSARHFPISVSACPRPVRYVTETGLRSCVSRSAFRKYSAECGVATLSSGKCPKRTASFLRPTSAGWGTCPG
jgi:hypothetical protein